MRSLVFSILLCSSALAAPSDARKPARANDDDLLSLASGAMVVQGATGASPTAAAWYLFDEDPATGWTVEHDALAASPLVLELPARARIDRLVVDASQLELDSRLPQRLLVEVSDESATSGFRPIADAALKLPNRDGVELAVTAKRPGRWIRITPGKPNGSTTMIQLMELRAYGERLAAPAAIDVTGTYLTDHGWFRLRQRGNVVTGCYEQGTRPLLGGIDGRVMTFTFEGGTPAATGPAILVVGSHGQVFGGYYATTDVQTHAVLEAITGARGDVKGGACPSDRAAEDPIATALARDGAVRLPGINFDTDSAKIRDDSRPTLDRVVTILKATPALRVAIAGHTDATATAAHNQTLSEQRAAAVVAYLVAAGIAGDRLEPHGYGQTKPIAPNDSALGRAQNRRVELAKLAPGPRASKT